MPMESAAVPGEVAGFLRDNDGFLISTHVNPDGDGIGSAMAMKWALTAMGKRAEIMFDSDPPESFAFLKNYQWVRKYEDGGEKFGAAVILDAPNIERLGGAAAALENGAKVLNIDHHVSNERFGAVDFVDESAASSAEIVFRIIKALGLSPDPDCAEYIYTGVIIDTGRFRFSNTSPATLRTAAELVAAGAEPARISENVYYNNTLETTRALGAFINSIETHLDGRLATAQFGLDYISSDQFRNVDTEGFVNHALAVRGVEVAIFLREVKQGVTRASLRAKTDFDVNELAGVFGGGGHAKAAGCTINMKIEDARAALIREAEKRL